jgi:hypothetical protein
MTTEQVRQAFRGADLRQFCPDRSRESYDLHCESVRVFMLADNLWGKWWFGRDTDPSREALVFRSTDLLVRLSAIMELESARLALDSN